MKKSRILFMISIVLVMFVACFIIFFGMGKREVYYNDDFKISFEKERDLPVTETPNSLLGKLNDNVTFAIFNNDVYDYVSQNIRDSVERSEMDFESGIFNAGFTNPIYLATFIKELFNDDDYEFYQFEKVSISKALSAYRCYFDSKTTRINGRCYFTVDDGRFYVFIFYISKDSSLQKKEEKLIDRFMSSLIIYPYNYTKE